jgi:hypothetical protein
LLQEIRQNWRLFRLSVPGRRFQDWYWHRCRRRTSNQSSHRKLLTLLVGLLIAAAGVVLLVTPGPGWLVIAVGGAVLAGESLWVARFCDAQELRLRRWARAGRALWRRVRRRQAD